MKSKGGLALAVLVLAGMAWFCVALGTALLTDPHVNLGGTAAALEHLNAPDGGFREAARSAIQNGGAITGWALLFALPIGLTLAAVPLSWAMVGGALQVFPALTLVLAWLAIALLLGQHATASTAALGATDLIVTRTGTRAALVVLLVPWFATGIEQSARRVSAVSLRVAATLGASWARRFFRLILPRIVGRVIVGAIVVFLIATLLLLARNLALTTRADAVRAAAATLPRDATEIAAFACAAAAALLGVWLLLRALHDVVFSDELGGGEVLDRAAH